MKTTFIIIMIAMAIGIVITFIAVADREANLTLIGIIFTTLFGIAIFTAVQDIENNYTRNHILKEHNVTIPVTAYEVYLLENRSTK